MSSESSEQSPKQSNGAILVDRDLRAGLGTWVTARSGAPAIDAQQVQPASLDLRLGPTAYRVRAGFLPSAAPLEERLEKLATSTLSLEGGGAVLERGLVYLVPLEEEFALPADVHGRFNPRSSTGRCDIFTRILCPGHQRFDELPKGYRGTVWLEIAPLSFPIRLRRGDRMCQVRLQRGRAALSRAELQAAHDETPLCFLGDEPVPSDEVRFDNDGGIELSLGLAQREPAGWHASQHSEVVDFGADGHHDPRDFFDPVQAHDGHCILEPGSFYIFASKERISIPPHLVAEMLPVDVGIGELRNNYAGFFDSGFGWNASGPSTGTPAVLEVRAHDVPFLVEDGQVFFRLRFSRTTGPPEQIYGQGREAHSYRNQDLTLGRMFRR
ncbi:MAG: dCTP deaminase [Chlamydiales bacterium]|jgi:dCTP deaminase